MSVPVTLKLADASEKTGLSKKVLSHAIRRGDLQATKPGKEVLVYWESLVKFLSRHRMKSA